MEDPMTSDQHSFHSARDSGDLNASMMSYTQHANNRSTIGENNLRLNIFGNILLLIGSLSLCAMDWFVLSTTQMKNGHAEPIEFYISVLSVRIEPKGMDLDINDFLEQCDHFNAFNEACADIKQINHCFTAFLIIMLMQVMLNTHTLITMFMIVKKRVTRAAVEEIGSASDDQESQMERVEMNQTFRSFDTARKSLATRLKFDASWESATWTLRAAIFLQVIALFQWVAFSPALFNPSNLQLGPFVDVVIIIGLFLVSCHRNYWQKQLELYANEAKYLGAYD